MLQKLIMDYSNSFKFDIWIFGFPHVDHLQLQCIGEGEPVGDGIRETHKCFSFLSTICTLSCIAFHILSYLYVTSLNNPDHILNMILWTVRKLSNVRAVSWVLFRIWLRTIPWATTSQVALIDYFKEVWEEPVYAWTFLARENM